MPLRLEQYSLTAAAVTSRVLLRSCHTVTSRMLLRSRHMATSRIFLGVTPRMLLRSRHAPVGQEDFGRQDIEQARPW
eukprot:3115027-Rhodomonas_salina.1